MSRMSFFVVLPPSLGTRISSAPRAAIWSRLSWLKASELTIRMRYPFAAQTSASDAPVLPPVYSTTVSPGRSRPSSSAFEMTACAIRSLRLPVGFSHSSLTRMSAQRGGTILRRRTIDVLPMASRMSIAENSPIPFLLFRKERRSGGFPAFGRRRQGRLTVPAPGEPPPGHGTAILGVRLAKPLFERRLLIGDDEEMEDQEHGDRVLQERHASEEPGLAAKRRQHAVVHRVSRETVESPHDKPARRIDRGQSAASRRSEVPDTAKQHCQSQGEQGRGTDRRKIPTGGCRLLGSLENAVREVADDGSRREDHEGGAADGEQKPHGNDYLRARIRETPSACPRPVRSEAAVCRRSPRR